MFRFVVSLLMLCSFAAHAALGCHWHHGHQNHTHETPQAPEKPVLAHTGPCGHHHAEDSAAQNDSAPGLPAECPSGCDELSCTYLTNGPTKLPMPEFQSLDGMPRLALETAFLPGSLAEWHRRSLEESPPPSGRSSVRDLTQVWQL